MQFTIKKDEFYFLSGPATLQLTSGVIEIFAVKVTAGGKVDVPTGQKIPVLAIEDTQIDITTAAEIPVKMETRSLPQEWKAVAEKIAAEKVSGSLYKVMVLGEVYTGKTFFSTYLANHLLEKVGKIAILDCDSGQSDVSCPGTFGMMVLDKPVIFFTEREPTHMYLLGAHSPGLHFAPALTGMIHLLRKAEKEVAALIIDTTGWVQGDGARALKKAKLDMIQPDKVVLMQHTNELEHLVKHLPAEKIVRLPVFRKTPPASQEERKDLREQVSRRYFVNSRVFEIPFSQVFTDRSYFLTGSRIDLEGTLHAERLSSWEGTLVVTSGPLLPDMMKNWPKDLGLIRSCIAGQEQGLMIALLDQQQDMLAIARLEKMDFLNNNFRIRSNYCGELGRIKGIQFGALKLTEEGNEAGFVEPGSF